MAGGADLGKLALWLLSGAEIHTKPEFPGLVHHLGEIQERHYK